MAAIGLTAEQQAKLFQEFTSMLSRHAGSVQRGAWHVVLGDRTGGISRCGDEMMRAMLYDAAQILLVRSTKRSWLKAWAMKIARHRGMKKAIVSPNLQKAHSPHFRETVL